MVNKIGIRRVVCVVSLVAVSVMGQSGYERKAKEQEQELQKMFKKAPSEKKKKSENAGMHFHRKRLWKKKAKAAKKKTLYNNAFAATNSVKSTK